MALHTAVYLSLIGAEGLRRINDLGYGGLRYLADGLAATGRMRLVYPERPTVNEALFRTSDPLTADMVLEAAAAEGILAGVKTDECELLVAVTEMQTKEDMDRYISIVKNIKL